MRKGFFSAALNSSSGPIKYFSICSFKVKRPGSLFLMSAALDRLIHMVCSWSILRFICQGQPGQERITNDQECRQR